MIVTIVTESFLTYAQALRTAVQEFDASIGFLALVTSVSDGDSLPSWTITTETLQDSVPRAQLLIERYSADDEADLLRWSLKSQLMAYAMQQGSRQVLWCDPDLMFYESPGLLFDMIEPQTILLSPHHRAISPRTDEVNFRKNFTEGLFQAGFLGAGQETTEVLDWWADCCEWCMCKDPQGGLWDDQRFLDLIPVFWSGTKILRHRGCNLAEWNQTECRRGEHDGQVRISETDPVVFIHFTDFTIHSILNGSDALLRPFLDQYLQRLREIDPTFELRLPSAESPLTPAAPPTLPDRLRSVARRLLKRTP